MLQENEAAEPERPGKGGAAGELPSVGTERWVKGRKAQVVAAVKDGRLTFDEACRRYNLSPDELASWERMVAQHGIDALRVTRLQDFRPRIRSERPG